MDQADRELQAIAQEAATLRGLLEALRTQEELTAAAETHLTNTAAALVRLQAQLEGIEQTNDNATRREIVELLVHRIQGRTEGEGRDR